MSCPTTIFISTGGVLVCTYVVELPNDNNGENTSVISARRNSITHDFVASKNWDFNLATVTEIDKCVTVSDNRYGSLGSICANQNPKVFSYVLNVGPYDSCWTYIVENIATLVTNTNYIHKSNDHSVSITFPCSGCTLPPGYWKTHSKFYPAPYDSTWNGLEDSIFFLSNTSYYNVLWISPNGNAYYILSSAWIAATLNVLKRTSVP